ncbi:MAG: hypothetical protein GC178_05930 [Flavobacteriales bacterium]|nr:hypothetical protein [Flavobacteriales bacterium]
MKNTLLVLTVVVMSSIWSLATAQNTDFDSRLLAKFSEKELKAMSADEVDYWNFFIKEGFEVFQITKDSDQSDIEVMEFDGDVSAINPLALGLTPKENSVQTFKLGNSGYGIMILSVEKLNARMKRLQKD